VHRGAFALTTITRGRTVSVRARNPNHSAWAGAPPHSGHHSASPAVLRSTHTSELFYLTAGSCDPARQEHFSSALETFVRRWRPATFDYVMHTGHRRVLSGLAGPHTDSTDSRGRSAAQSEQILTAWIHRNNVSRRGSGRQGRASERAAPGTAQSEATRPNTKCGVCVARRAKSAHHMGPAAG
jgi:hypothetical protein